MFSVSSPGYIRKIIQCAREERAMRDIDIDPTHNKAVEPVDTATGATPTVSGIVATASFDDDDELEPTIVRGRE